MIGSLWTGISGLAGSQTALDNESNNIANVNTIGFKSSRISFADQMYQNNIGKGTQVLASEKIYNQGNLKTTGVNYDVALSGDGFFTVSNTRGGGTAETYYTRAGNFRMGDSGTLQDTVGNEIQGWAMSSEPVVVTSNPNIEKFTSDYTKLLASKIISYSSSIETITAKATDYTATAVSDSSTIFTGAGLKSKYGKIADVEELVKAYSTALQNLKNEPNSSSASAKAQLSHIDYPDQTSSDAIAQDGDQVYIYIDGNKISQSFISGTNQADGYRKTMKAFADKISETPGIKAYVADSTSTPDTSDTSVDLGIIRIESLIPGLPFTISSGGMVHAGNDKPTSGIIDSAAEAGKGVGALESIKTALDKAVTGKQQDVYTPSDLAISTGTDKIYNYSITIYDTALKKNVDIGLPADVTTDNVNDIVDAINSTTGSYLNNKLPEYVKAFNINGNLVVKTLDSNFDTEFSGALNVSEYGSTITTAGVAPVAPDPGVKQVTTFNYPTTPSPSASTAFQLTLTSPDATVVVNGATDLDNLISILNTSGTDTAPATGFDDFRIGYVAGKDSNGYLTITAKTASATPFTTKLEIGTGTTGTSTFKAGDILLKRNGDYSGREGAGAEFMEIKTRIDQTASKGSLQLRLDSLKISDSAFGDFNVDSTGLITMSQDGAMFAVGQVAIARFITNRGLEPIGNNLLKSTLASGDPIYNLNNNKTAEIKSNTLELSTADLSESLVNLMVFQRAFEANSKSITTADTVLNTLIQLKR